MKFEPRKKTAWHYVNIPLNEGTYKPDDHCVIGYIQANLAADQPLVESQPEEGSAGSVVQWAMESH